MAPKHLHPFEIERRRVWVLTNLQGRVLRLGGWFLLGAVLAQLLFVPYWDAELSAVPVLRSGIHLLPVLAVVGGLATLVLQGLCTHETYHHEVFASPAAVTRVRLGFPVIALTAALTLTLPAVAFSPGYPRLTAPYIAAYAGLSGLSLALGIEYGSKIVWDYTKPTEPSFTRLGAAGGLVLIAVVGLGFHVLEPDGSVLERLAVTIAALAPGAVGWLWFTHHYELWQRRETDSRDYDEPSALAYTFVRDSRGVSVLAGLVFGVGLPVVFGVHRLATSGVDPERASVALVYADGIVDALVYGGTALVGIVVLAGLGYLLGNALFERPD